jgi:hypothetical protein
MVGHVYIGVRHCRHTWVSHISVLINDFLAVRFFIFGIDGDFLCHFVGQEGVHFCLECFE